MPPTNQRVAPLVQRFIADLASIEHVHDIDAAPERRTALRTLYRSWQARTAELDFDALGLEDRIDYVLFRRELAHRDAQLDFEATRYAQAAPLLPGVEALTALTQARRALRPVDGRRSADALTAAGKAIAAMLKRIDIEKQPSNIATPIVAYRAARIVDETRQDLRQWHAFYAGYDPQFDWWTRQPYAALDAQLEQYAKTLRDRLAGASDPATIVGDPIGRAALLADLADELIDYTPEALIGLAERELAWCRREMDKAARELGYDDWRKALAYVKTLHVAPGEQPQLTVQLADEAIQYVTSNDLVSVPEIAKRDWQMNMLSPAAQLQAPFFLGGRDVYVSFPTDAMPHDKKLDSLRGNNRHFSRAVVHHELIPGHHLQQFYNARYQTQRELFDTPFWTEGWALYWEFLLYERGYARSSEDRIGMLFWRSHRAARIIFSLSFHLGKMTPEQAVDLLVDRVGHERENAAGEVRRSFAGNWSPLYQVAYMVGGLQFRALRTELVESGRMTDRQFHDAILEGGPMPVQMVRARLLARPPAQDQAADWKFYDIHDRSGAGGSR